jgi:anti-sigma regulatory factor (Ser/Thr protein kinase)
MSTKAAELLRKLILSRLRQRGTVRVREIVALTGLSRAYVHRFFKQLTDEGVIARIGETKQAHYVPAAQAQTAKEKIRTASYRLPVAGLQEHEVLQRFKRETGVLSGLAENVKRIVEYAFSEMLNNAIEHSRSELVTVSMSRSDGMLSFHVVDQGVGVFRNIMDKHSLDSELAALQDLLKGKQTTAPDQHSGEGIFFTSKAVDRLELNSHEQRLVFDNMNNDVFVKSGKFVKGTVVRFAVATASQRRLEDVFKPFTNDKYKFDKTAVNVRLFKGDVEYVSRSQARRLLAGLDKFQSIVLDFRDVATVGQGFADEIFAIWLADHPGIKITYVNANENVEFMIKRALARTHQE